MSAGATCCATGTGTRYSAIGSERVQRRRPSALCLSREKIVTLRTLSALTALAVFRSANAYETIAAARVGRIVRAAGSDDEVRFAAEVDALPLVAMLRGDRVVRVD